MHTEVKRFTEWLTPVPEEEYLRILYVGKIQIDPTMSNGHKHESSLNSIEGMINEIWNVAKYWKQINAISGHLS